jgi:hypothetical protein
MARPRIQRIRREAFSPQGVGDDRDPRSIEILVVPRQEDGRGPIGTPERRRAFPMLAASRSAMDPGACQRGGSPVICAIAENDVAR